MPITSHRFVLAPLAVLAHVHQSASATSVPHALYNILPSTDMSHALTLLSVVSVACHRLIPENCGLSDVDSHIILLASPSARASISHVHAVLLPNILFVGIC